MTWSLQGLLKSLNWYPCMVSQMVKTILHLPPGYTIFTFAISSPALVSDLGYCVSVVDSETLSRRSSAGTWAVVISVTLVSKRPTRSLLLLFLLNLIPRRSQAAINGSLPHPSSRSWDDKVKIWWFVGPAPENQQHHDNLSSLCVE